MNQPLPALSVALASTNAVTDGTDVYRTSTVDAQGIPQNSPVAYIRVGRGIQALHAADWHVG